ncbi:hypothetical protein NQ176_g8773 [Zarea fungicola]|uniref:Uncharacterized protein n=1 Tax=Zarea fungicola TaxID=93591 RepID=A0ACC1MQD5_9HYPO|nr:hypothetical protein NQ176_g8773 [Lecanicillium fungicola]
MFHAIASGNVIIVETLVQTGFAVIPPQLGKALQSGNEAMVRALLSGGINLACAQWLSRKALACAAQGGLLHFVETLLPNADSAERHEALLCAVESRHWGVASAILDDDRARAADAIFWQFPFASWYLLTAKKKTTWRAMRATLTSSGIAFIFWSGDSASEEGGKSTSGKVYIVNF